MTLLGDDWRRLASVTVLALVVALLASGARASDPVNKDSQGLALGGYDAVAYFTEDEPVAGGREFETEWSGTKWRFSSAENKDTFLEAPEKHAPQYGGYCAYAVSKGGTANGDPTVWRMVGGKLYLNLNRGVQQLWVKDIPGNIAKADKNWPGVVKR